MLTYRSSAFVLLLLVTQLSTAAPPAIRTIDRAGLQAGGTTILTIDGENLLPDPRLVVSFPIARQTVLPKGTEKKVQIEVVLDKNVVPGFYNLRLANPDGVSGGQIVAVDHLPQQTWQPEVAALPISLHGNLTGSNRLATTFPGKKGQTILCEVEAQRLGGKIRPVVHLLDESGKQLAWSRPMPLLGGDTRLQVTLPADGKFSLEIHDLQYNAASPGTLRLKLGEWSYVDAVFPQALERGKSANLELVGNQPGQRIPAQGKGDSPALVLPWANAGNASGLRPWVMLSDLPEFVENESQPVQDVPVLPVGLNGRINKPGQIDKFKLKVQPGQKLKFDLYAERLGSGMDAVLKLLRDNGQQLAQADDRPGSPDPLLDYTVPKDVTSLTVAVEDLHGRGKDAYLYRVVVRPADGDEQNFRALLPAGEFNVPTGTTRIYEVEIDRLGYQGPLQLAFDKLPAGVQLQGGDVPAGATGALLILTGNGAPGTQTASLRATSTDPQVKLARVAVAKEHTLEKLQPWLAEELVVSLTPAEKTTFAANFNALPTDARLVPGSTLKVPVAFAPPPGENGGVRIYLLTSQGPVLAQNNRPDPNRNLRVDKGNFLEIPAGKMDGEFNIVVPATLPTLPHDIAFRVELLSKDKKQVLAETYTAARRLAVENPLLVTVATPAIELPIDPKTGADIKLAGKVERRAGLKGDVAVSVSGLPQGLPVPNVPVKANQSDYAAVIKIPANFQPGEFTIEVFATGKLDPKAQIPNKSDGVPVKIKLVAKK
ncbi:MAG: hypothetical protein AB7K24_23020 [Gemmataceae bacterium]